MTDDMIDDPTPAAAEARATIATERDAKDFAVEFGGYLATSAEAFLNLLNRTRAIRVNLSGATTDAISDHFRGLHGAIYEFRKRADRILNPTPAAEARAPAAQIDAAIRAWEEFPADGIPSVRGALTPMGQRALQAALDAALSLPPPEAKEGITPAQDLETRLRAVDSAFRETLEGKVPEPKDGAAPPPETGWRRQFCDWVNKTWGRNQPYRVLAGTTVTVGQLFELAAMLLQTAPTAAPAAPSPDLAALGVTEAVLNHAWAAGVKAGEPPIWLLLADKPEMTGRLRRQFFPAAVQAALLKAQSK